MHGVTICCSTQRSTAPSIWLAHFCHHLWMPSNTTLCHQLCTKVFVLAPWQTDWALSISVFQVRILPWAVACSLTSWEASSRSSLLLMSPGLLWQWASSCTAPDRIQIPKTVGMSYSPLSCKLSFVLHWSRYVWLLEYSVQSCSWFGSLCLSEIHTQEKKKETFTSKTWIQVHVIHHKISEEVKKARPHYYRVKLIKFPLRNFFIYIKPKVIQLYYLSVLNSNMLQVLNAAVDFSQSRWKLSEILLMPFSSLVKRQLRRELHSDADINSEACSMQFGICTLKWAQRNKGRP